MAALLIVMAMGILGGAGVSGSSSGEQPVYSLTDDSAEASRSPGTNGLTPGWLAGCGAEEASSSILPAWISGILDSPVLRTPMRVRISRSGFTLGWRLSFSL
jgi:hypothetical protein